MERRIAMTRAVLIASLAILFCAPAGAQNRVLLVADQASPIETLSSFEVRKLYLGISVFSNGHAIHPLRNIADPRLNDTFLQSVVGLSEEVYSRRLLANVFKFGTVRPDEYRDDEQLAQALHSNPYAVSYIWVSGAPPPGLKVLRVLWQDY
jgi:hypothetical protein